MLPTCSNLANGRLPRRAGLAPLPGFARSKKLQAEVSSRPQRKFCQRSPRKPIVSCVARPAPGLKTSTRSTPPLFGPSYSSSQELVEHRRCAAVGECVPGEVGSPGSGGRQCTAITLCIHVQARTVLRAERIGVNQRGDRKERSWSSRAASSPRSGACEICRRTSLLDLRPASGRSSPPPICTEPSAWTQGE
jgi:hypothetical protein